MGKIEVNDDDHVPENPTSSSYNEKSFRSNLNNTTKLTKQSSEAYIISKIKVQQGLLPIMIRHRIFLFCVQNCAFIKKSLYFFERIKKEIKIKKNSFERFPKFDIKYLAFHRKKAKKPT